MEQFVHQRQRKQSYWIKSTGNALNATPPQVSPGNERRNSILATCHYLVLGSASDWLKICFNQSEALPRSGHLYGVSMLVPQTLFPWETSGGVAKCRLYSQAFSNTLSSVSHLQFSSTLEARGAGGGGGSNTVHYWPFSLKRWIICLRTFICGKIVVM